jgi:hypothetical protein
VKRLLLALLRWYNSRYDATLCRKQSPTYYGGQVYRCTLPLGHTGYHAYGDPDDPGTPLWVA